MSPRVTALPDRPSADAGAVVARMMLLLGRMASAVAVGSADPVAMCFRATVSPGRRSTVSRDPVVRARRPVAVPRRRTRLAGTAPKLPGRSAVRAAGSVAARRAASPSQGGGPLPTMFLTPLPVRAAGTAPRAR
jgi:hypothetical protein